MRFSSAVIVVAILLSAGSAALADEWTAVRLRGQVLELVGKQWQVVPRGTAVADGTVVRSLASGYADFVRGTETVSISPNTELVISDKAAAGSKPFTTVTEYFGTVAVEADIENVKHFAVLTPYLAAEVKGTRFTVTSGATGASVTVERGRVAVDDLSDHEHATISIGQTALVIAGHHSRKHPLIVTGATLASTIGAQIQSLKGEDSGLDDSTDGTESGKGEGHGNGNTDNGKGNGGVAGNGKGNQGN